MRTEVDLDESLISKAQELSGHDDLSQLLGEALRALIQRESIKHRSRLTGSEPQPTYMPETGRSTGMIATGDKSGTHQVGVSDALSMHAEDCIEFDAPRHDLTIQMASFDEDEARRTPD